MSRTMLVLLGTAILLLAVGGWMVDAARKPLALWSAHSRTSTVS